MSLGQTGANAKRAEWPEWQSTGLETGDLADEVYRAKSLRKLTG